MAVLSIWTLYDHPKDYPEHYVARRHESSRDGTRATGEIILSKNLAELRQQMMHRGLTPLMRSAQDDPVILESWL